jgi:cobalt/nickel transport system permease protein
MHMADALISPAVGGTMWAAALGLGAVAVRKVQSEMDDKKVPLMGVMGAFIFAAQMINFSIPGTGSSGHLGGGLILSIILGPYAGFLVMASVLVIQALFFADGGLLALGCNVINLGFFTCFIAYPLIYKKMATGEASKGRRFAAATLAAVAGLQMGAFGVVLETLLSGKTELPFGTFVLLMQPIHLAIGIVEGLVTAAVVGYVRKVAPGIVESANSGSKIGDISAKKALIGLAVAAVVAGACLSWFASANPDGLEWSMEKTSGSAELEASDDVHQAAAKLQGSIAFLPDYGFKTAKAPEPAEAAWPSVSAGTSVAGLVGGAMTLLLAVAAGFGLRAIKSASRKRDA